MKKFPTIDATWTLFLDRDGVINERLPDDYVKKWADFTFTEGAHAALATFAQHFGRIVVVTNQAGISKGLYSEADLAEIHALFLAEVGKNGGRIDKIYHAPGYDERRKPDIGMAAQAKLDFPEIDFTKSVMVGDSTSDMAFGRRIGAVCVFIQGKGDDPSVFSPDFSFKSLADSAKTMFEH